MSVLDLAGVSVVRGGRVVVQDASLRVAAGEIVAVGGPSGSGKTSLLRAVAGLEPLFAGRVLVGEVTLSPGPLPGGRARAALHGHVGLVFQFHHLFAHLSVLDNVVLAPVHVAREPRASAVERAMTLLDGLGVGHLASSRPKALSGGEAQRVAIARALAMRPVLLLLDEPTASLDPARRGEFGAMLRALAGEGRAIVMATHDTEFARTVASRRAVLEGGRLTEVA
ncbi:MAG: ATP-binding cassette domain-containing protein [Vicinamibacterales bacterium]